MAGIAAWLGGRIALRHQCESPPQRAASQSRVRRLWQRPDTAFTAIRRKETPWGRKDFGAVHADDRWQLCRRRLRAECFEIGERPGPSLTLAEHMQGCRGGRG